MNYTKEAQGGEVKCPCLLSFLETTVGIEPRSPDRAALSVNGGLVFTELLAVTSRTKKKIAKELNRELNSVRLGKGSGLWPTVFRAWLMPGKGLSPGQPRGGSPLFCLSWCSRDWVRVQSSNQPWVGSL